MEVLLDTNVLADIFLRPKLAPASHRVVEWCKIPGRRAWISWPTVATLAYLFEEAGRTPAEITTRMRLLRSWTEIASAGTALFDSALALNMADFEDAIQAAHTESCGARGAARGCWCALSFGPGFGGDVFTSLTFIDGSRVSTSRR